MRNKTYIGLLLSCVFATCEPIPALAVEDRVPTADDVIAVMSQIPEERCLYGQQACRERAGHYEHGPDARRIAEAIVAAADGSLTGTRLGDASLMAVFTSYESGNDASARGDCKDADRRLCRSNGAFQLMFITPEVAFDPAQAAPVWRAIARGSIKACKDNPDDEKLASVAGSCSFWKARQKVRQRVQLAREQAASLTALRASL